MLESVPVPVPIRKGVQDNARPMDARRVASHLLTDAHDSLALLTL